MNTSLYTCGIDEAGRGPLAGPVCAAAVILPQEFNYNLLNDSKVLSEKKRLIAASEIMLHAYAWHIGWASNTEIDEFNILQASLLAMRRAYEGMISRFSLNQINIEVIIDGTFCPTVQAAKLSALPKADANFPSVMAASILAKTARDRMMLRYDWLYPEYNYAQHKGYPTKAHVASLNQWGEPPIQRKSFNYKKEDKN